MASYIHVEPPTDSFLNFAIGENMSRNCELQKEPHLAEMAAQLNSFRSNESMCDVTVRVRNHAFRAHKLILASTSGFFKTTFVTRRRQSIMPEIITLNEYHFGAESFSTLLNYMYTGDLALNMDTVFEILACAGHLQVTHAIKACEDYINQAYEENRLTFQFCLQVCSTLSRCGIDGKASAAYRYLATTFSEVCQGEQFLKQVTSQNMADLLDRNDLQVTDESEILDAVASWLNYDWRNRKVHAMDLLGRVRLGLIPLEKIISVFETQLQDDDECRTLYVDIMKYHSLGKKTFVSRVLHDVKQKLIFTKRMVPEQTLIAIGSESFRFVEDRTDLRKVKTRIPTIGSKGHVVAVANGKLYCAGGTCSVSGSGSKSFLEYAKKSNKWVRLPEMSNTHYPDQKLGLIYANGRLCAIRGGGHYRDVNTYNIRDRKWDKGRYLDYPLSVDVNPPLSIARFQDFILLAGHKYDAQLKEHRHIVMMLNTQTRTWNTVHNSDLGEFPELHVFVTDGKIYLIAFGPDSSEDDADSYESPTRTDFTDDESSQCPTSPTVFKCHCKVTPTSPVFTVQRKIPQTCVPATKMRVFRIRKEVYIIVSGYVYKTRVTIAESQVYDADLSGYSCLESVDNENYAVTSYNID